MEGPKKRARIGDGEREGRRSEAGELMLAVEDDQQRLAALLHNDLQQLLLACRLSAQVLLGSRDAKAKDNVARELADLLDRAMKATRGLTAELAGAGALSEEGLASALSRLAAGAPDKRRIVVEVDPMANPADPALGAYLFRLVREIVREQAGTGGEPVRVSVARDGDRLRLDIDGTAPALGESAGGWRRCTALFGVAVQAREKSVTLLAPLA